MAAQPPWPSTDARHAGTGWIATACGLAMTVAWRPSFDLVMVLTMTLVMIESTGMFLALSDITGKKIDQKALGAGLIPLVAPRRTQQMAHSLHPLLESGILLTAISAVLLNLFFNGSKADERAAIEAAKTAEAH